MRIFPAALLMLTASLALPLEPLAQDKVTVHGSIQADALFPETDATIGTENYKDKILFNAYANVGLFSKYVDAGVRVEYMEHPLPGYEPDFKGWGLGNIYVKGRLYNCIELTAGDFYEQFGSGFILRTYEDRSLGIDNSIRGGRMKVNAVKGLRFTILGGVQRRYWEWSVKSKLLGLDAEFDLQDYIKPLAKRDIVWNIGASYVVKHESDEEIYVSGSDDRLNLPKNVRAFDVRTHFYKSGLDLKAEFAMKGQDPSFYNHYTYGHGTAFLLSAGYSRTGFSTLLQAKRSDNMAFRSRRTESTAATFINNLPPFNYTHTYALAALYPYATQEAPGEWAFQGAVAYNFKRGTALGGKYGTKLKLNASYICGIDRKPVADNPSDLAGTDWWDPDYTSKLGDTYYTDINLQMDKRVTKATTLNLMYMFQKYNQTVIEGHGGMINSHIFVAEGKYKLNKKFTLRSELQYLLTKEDQKDWLYGLAELSFAPYLMVTVSDMWNVGDTKTHYYMASLTGNYRNHRLLVGYGRTRAGFNCAGGVCRYVPATRGFQISYNFNF